mgnify:CR=1 FL=1|jgi:hypothetical protein
MKRAFIKWALISFVLTMVLQGVLFSNKYEVVSQNGTELIVDRKGQLLKFYNVTPKYKMDSITLYFDYDINYRGLHIK